jgi:hypothetical protein
VYIFVKIIVLKRILLLFMLFVCSQQLVFSQSSFNLGLGVGHQFGLPGLRACYTLKKMEYSVNSGISQGTLCFGSGISYRLAGNKIGENYLTYNLGMFLFKESGVYNSTITPVFVHSLTNNIELGFEESRFKIRVGYGFMYLPNTSFAKRSFAPSLSLGVILPIWKKD